MSKNEKWNVRPGNPMCLGTTRTWEGYNFAVENSERKSLKLAFYKTGEKEPIKVISIPEEWRTGDVYAVEVQNSGLEEYEYMYFMESEPRIDINTRLICGRNTFGQNLDSVEKLRGKVLKKADVCDLKEKISYEDMIVYKVHARGYTMQEDSGVKEKGTFLGLVEKIPYWKELGITSLQLMPVYDYLECTWNTRQKPLVNYWGYTEGFYFAPKASFSNGQPDMEMKKLISELHLAGIECLMEFYFTENVTPDRILDILRFWKMEYHIDGFVLLNAEKWIELLAKDAILSDAKLIASDLSPEIYGKKEPKMRRLAKCNSSYQDAMRQFLRGDEGHLEAFLQYNKQNASEYGILQYITNHDGFTLADLVSYNWRHNDGNGESNRDGKENNYSWNCGEEGPTKKNQIIDLRLRQMRNAILMLMLSQATPMLYGGDEFGNSQKGNNNAYCQDNEIGWVDWSLRKEMKTFTDFVKKVIAFRKTHPILHMPYELNHSDPQEFGWPQISYHSTQAWVCKKEKCSCQLGILYCGDYAKKEYGVEEPLIYVAYNMYWAEYKMALPDLPEGKNWYVAINSGHPTEESIFEAGKEMKITDKKYIRLQGRTIIVLLGK